MVQRFVVFFFFRVWGLGAGFRNEDVKESGMSGEGLSILNSARVSQSKTP